MEPHGDPLISSAHADTMDHFRDRGYIRSVPLEPAHDGSTPLVPAAAIARRAGALALDLVIQTAPLLVALPLYHSTTGVGRSLLWASASLLTLAISIVNSVVLVARTGQSLGKRRLAIRIVDRRTGQNPGVVQVIWREFLAGLHFGVAWHPVTGAPFVVMVGPWIVIDGTPALFDPRWHRTLHDRWSNTVVIDARAQYEALVPTAGHTAIVDDREISAR
jgi:uncharacterized RDD family membrane protein YckC